MRRGGKGTWVGRGERRRLVVNDSGLIRCANRKDLDRGGDDKVGEFIGLLSL